jgi:hypothetical protein
MKEPMYKLMDLWLTQKQLEKVLRYANDKNLSVNHWIQETIGRRLFDIEHGLDSGYPEYKGDNAPSILEYKKLFPNENTKDEFKDFHSGVMGEQF